MFQIIKIIIKEKWFKFLGIQFYKKNFIELDFNYLENRIYYLDKKKSIPTGKDLCRSIKMIYEMTRRTNVFDDIYYLKLDNFANFIIKYVKSGDKDIQKLIFGSQKFDYELLIDYCEALDINTININNLLKQIYQNK